MKTKIGEVEYTQKKFKGRLVRNLLEIQNHLKNTGEEMNNTEVDMILEFICLCFDNQFTPDDLLDELEWVEIQKLFIEIQEKITGKVTKKSVNSKK